MGSLALPQPFVLDQIENTITDGSLSAFPHIDQEFSNAFNKKYGRKPGVYGANGYASIMLIHDYLLEDMAQDRSSIKNSLNNLPDEISTIFGAVYPNDQEIPFELFPVEIQNGEVLYK